MATLTSIVAHDLDAILPCDARRGAQLVKRVPHLGPIGKPRARPFREAAPQQLTLPAQQVPAPQSCPCSPLLWDAHVSHASLPSSPLMNWGEISPELFSTPATPFGLVISPLQLQALEAQVVKPSATLFPSFEAALQACQEVDSFFSSGNICNPLGPIIDVTPPRSPAELPSGTSSSCEGTPEGASVETEEDAELAEAKELNGRVLEGTRCPHRKSWKRLRAKKGCAFFVCFHCGAKWRTKSGEANASDS
eukprot:EG_transcript_5137